MPKDNIRAIVVKKYLILFIGFFWITNTFATSLETHICIKNETGMAHKIEVSGVDSHDWDGNSRPDRNFNNIIIESGQTICNREEVNYFAKEPTFHFLVDGVASEMNYTKNQNQINDKSWYTSRRGLLAGYAFNPYYDVINGGSYCKGEGCKLFVINGSSNHDLPYTPTVNHEIHVIAKFVGPSISGQKIYYSVEDVDTHQVIIPMSLALITNNDFTFSYVLGKSFKYNLNHVVRFYGVRYNNLTTSMAFRLKLDLSDEVKFGGAKHFVMESIKMVLTSNPGLQVTALKPYVESGGAEFIDISTLFATYSYFGEPRPNKLVDIKMQVNLPYQMVNYASYQQVAESSTSNLVGEI